MTVHQFKESDGPSVNAFRVPPQDLESEQAVLGAMILSQKAIYTVSNILNQSDFYREGNKLIFSAIMALTAKNEPVDLITLSAILKQTKINSGDAYDGVGGINTLTTLIDRTPTAANVEFYANIVKEHSKNRKIIKITSQAEADAYCMLNSEEISERLINEIITAENFTETIDSMVIAGDVLESVVKKEKSPFILTGFKRFDEAIDGARRGILTTITGQSEEGKSTFVQNVVLSMAKREVRVAYIYLDDNPAVLTKRHVCMMQNWKMKKFQGFDNHELSFDQKALALSEWGKLGIRLCGRKQVGNKFSALKLWMLKEWKQNGIQIFVIDSGDRIQNAPTYGESRYDAQERMVDELEQFAQATNTALWAIVGQSKTKKDKFSIKDEDEGGTNGWRKFARLRLYVNRNPDDENISIVKVTKNSDGPKGSFYFDGDRDTYRWKQRELVTTE